MRCGDSVLGRLRHPLFYAATTALTLAVWWVQVARAGIDGSKHDFSNKDWGGDSCSACHGTESEPPKAAPVWNPKADLNRTLGAPLDRSKRAGLGTTMCLRCHDGTVAKATITPAPASARRIANLQNPDIFRTGHQGRNHPVGVRYPRVDKGFHPASEVTAAGAVTLPDGKVECISCHDPHGMSGQPAMLVMSNARSALCLTCHRK